MNYTIASIKYILKNFWYILPFSILPALFLSLSIDKFAIQKVLTDYFTGKPGGSFPIIFRAVSVFNFRDVGAFFAGLAGIVLMVVCVSLMMALIEKHMRIGKRTYNGIFSKLNDNLLSTCGICLFYVLIYEVWAVLISALLFLAYLVENVFAVYILSAIIFFGMHFVLLYVVSLFYLWLPCLQITGFRAFEALRYSYQLVAPVKMRIVFGQWISVTISEILIGLTAIFVPVRGFSFAAAAVLYMFMTVMFCVRMQVAYFDRAQLERADLKKYYHF
ncbi:MAG: hypothetical protein ACLSTV_10195 [Coriobacteriales bacterium]|jgi:membrane protein|nr:MAG TPA: Membrane domain of glycerophosphoryl diester phosphodiesterase [Caudoviricetes sp.]DAR74634.1 MAG TPA: Membrane domain of glycerophosphoryl diester phosphodiesterase [Bacteriophage sp.]